MQFTDLNLSEALLRALTDQGYTTPTPIQQQAIAPLLSGRDVLGCAQTGTGKTAAFSLPILQHLSSLAPVPPDRRLRALVLAPTRELAVQIGESLTDYAKYTRLTSTVIFGGVGQEPQVRALRRGVDILVATPGRLMDLMGQGHVRLQHVEVLVLDEADRMLDMGFIRDVRKILLSLQNRKQTAMFSATMAPEVESLAVEILRDPVRVSVTPAATTVDRIDQSVYFVPKAAKRDLLEHLLTDPSLARVIVFTRTKHGADKVVRHLDQVGVEAAALHGNKSQNARTRALEGFRSGRTRVLVATDIAARGLHIDGVTHVINHDLPDEPDSYVHRIGRTARAGEDGRAMSFCDEEERDLLRDIEKRIRLRVPVVAEHPFSSRSAVPAARQAEHRAPKPATQPARQPRPEARQAQPSNHGRPQQNQPRAQQNQARAQQGQPRTQQGQQQSQPRAQQGQPRQQQNQPRTQQGPSRHQAAPSRPRPQQESAASWHEPVVRDWY